MAEVGLIWSFQIVNNRSKTGHRVFTIIGFRRKGPAKLTTFENIGRKGEKVNAIGTQIKKTTPKNLQTIMHEFSH